MSDDDDFDMSADEEDVSILINNINANKIV